MQSRKSYQAIARAVENLVREHFHNGSSNRIEDQFDIKKYKIALAETHRRSTTIMETSLDLTTDEEAERFASYYATCDKYTSGNCQAQATWAMAQYIKADIYPVYLVLFGEHQMIILGDYINHPESAFIHDPHGHEIYPYQELALGGHHANRFGDTIQNFLKKEEHWNPAKRNEFLNGQYELMHLQIEDEKEIAEQPEILRNKKYWDEKIKELNEKGIVAFDAKEWDVAISTFQKAITLTINIYGETSHRLESIFYNLASAYFEKNQLAEARYFFRESNKLRLDNLTWPLILTNMENQMLSRLRCTIKLAFVDLAMGETDSAIKLYQTIISIASNPLLKEHEEAKNYKDIAESQLEILLPKVTSHADLPKNQI